MEKKQGFFSTLKDEVKRGLSPSRSRTRSRSSSPTRTNPHMKAFLWGRKKLIASSGGGGYYLPQPDTLTGKSSSLRPVMEGPDLDDDGGRNKGEISGDSKRIGSGLGHWVMGQLSRAPSVTTATAAYRRSDLRLLLGVMGAPLAPIHVSSSSSSSSSDHLLHKDNSIVKSQFF